MSKALEEVDEKIERAENSLTDILARQEEAEAALAEARARLSDCEESVRELSNEEGEKRRIIGDLKRMRNAFEQADGETLEV